MPDWLLQLFARYGYAAIFVGVMAEGAGVPVPGETMLLAGGALAHFGRLSLGWVMLTAMAGAVTGDNFGFLVGRIGGRTLAERYGPKLGLTAARLAEFDRFFARHGRRTIVIARFVTGIRVVCAVLAGGSDLPWRTFALYNAMGVIAWSIVIGLVGYFLGKSWDTLVRWIGRTGVVALVIVGTLVVVVALRTRRERTADSTRS